MHYTLNIFDKNAFDNKIISLQLYVINKFDIELKVSFEKKCTLKLIALEII